MGRWIDPQWYRYLWGRTSVDLRVSLTLVALSAVGIGGFFAFQAVGASASQPASATFVPLTTTVRKVVRVKENGRVVVKRVPVVKQVYAKPVTVVQTRLEKTPAGTVLVTRPVVRYRPVYRRSVVTVNGKPVTVNKTQTQLLTTIDERTSTVVQHDVVTQTQTVSQPRRTVTEVTTVTQSPQTVTQPAQTVTVTGPATTVISTVISTVLVTTTRSK